MEASVPQGWPFSALLLRRLDLGLCRPNHPLGRFVECCCAASFWHNGLLRHVRQGLETWHVRRMPRTQRAQIPTPHTAGSGVVKVYTSENMQKPDASKCRLFNKDGEAGANAGERESSACRCFRTPQAVALTTLDSHRQAENRVPVSACSLFFICLQQRWPFY